MASSNDYGSNQLYINNLPVNAAYTYKWTFEAKSDNDDDKIHTELWGGRGFLDQPLTKDWQFYSSSGQFNSTYPILYFWGVNGNKGNVYVRKIQLYKIINS